MITSNIIMYNMRFLLLIFFLLFSISRQSQTLQLSQFNCLLIYNKLADSSLSLDHCESININQKIFFQQNWKQCISSCCGLSFQTYPNFNQNSLVECQNSNQIVFEANNLVKIVIITLSTIVGVFLIIAILQKLCKKSSNNQVQQDTYNTNQTNDINKPIWRDCLQEDSHVTLNNLVNQQYKECPICLEDNTNVVTTCQHNFHIICLLNWFRKNRNCPLCKRTKIDNLKLYCKNCNNRYILLSVSCTIKNIQKWRDFVNVCDSCNASPKVRGRASTRDTSFGKINCSKVLDDIEIIQL